MIPKRRPTLNPSLPARFVRSSGVRPFRALPFRHRLLVVVLGAMAFFSTGVRAAMAEPPFAVEQLLTDRAEALGTHTAEVKQALEAVPAETGGTLHVVLVSTFDGVAAAEWVEQVATQSEIGSSYLLLAIDVEAHAYEWWLGDTAPWDVTEVDQLITAVGEPAVEAGDWAGGITAVAQGLRTGEIPAAASSGNEVEAPASSTATTTSVIGFVVLLVLAGFQYSRRATGRQEEETRRGEGQTVAHE